MSLQPDEKVAVVTGGASGIGFAISERLPRAVARVVIADRGDGNAIATAERLGSDGGEAVSLRTEHRRFEEVCERGTAPE